MTERTPSMKQLREDWISLMITSDGYFDGISEEMAEEQWDRALAAHDAEVLREAAYSGAFGTTAQSALLTRAEQIEATLHTDGSTS